MATAFYQTNLAALREQHPEAELSAVTYQVGQEFFESQKEIEMEKSLKGFTSVIVLSQDFEIVLARKPYGAPGWCLPGGGVELDESFIEGAKREILEELGVRLENVSLIMIEEETFLSPSGESTHSLLGVFAGDMRKFALPPLTDDAKEEGLELALFDPENLPEEMGLTDRQKIEAYLYADDDSAA